MSGIGHGPEFRRAQLWTWSEADRIVKSILNLRRSLRKKQTALPVWPGSTQAEREANVAKAIPGASAKEDTEDGDSDEEEEDRDVDEDENGRRCRGSW